jgi:hypothetical protein
MLGGACGGKSDAPSAPTPTPTPTPSPTPAPSPGGVINMAGNWSGTLRMSGSQPRTISMLIVQAVDCVDGAYRTEPAEWLGAISGYASSTSFNGVLSFQRADESQGKCSGSGVSDAAFNGDTLTFTASGFIGTCPEGFPESVTLTLRRQ